MFGATIACREQFYWLSFIANQEKRKIVIKENLASNLVDSAPLVTDKNNKALYNEVIIPFVTNNLRGGRFVSSGAFKDIAFNCPREISNTTAFPGSSWLYIKVYCGPQTATALLLERIAPIVRRQITFGNLDKWFFIYYSDPDFHVRVRLHAPNDRVKELWAIYQEIFDALMESQYMNHGCRLVVDTYQREIHRYGGSETCKICESIFMVDSEACLEIMRLIKRHESSTDDIVKDFSWMAAILSAHYYLCYCLDDESNQFKLLQEITLNYNRERGAMPGFKQLISDKYRIYSDQIQELLWKPQRDFFVALHKVYNERRNSMRPHVREVLKRIRNIQDYQRILASLVHMSMDRLIPIKLRDNELVVYEFLLRQYRTKIARESRLRPSNVYRADAYNASGDPQ